ncbi:hypothetical protein GCM10022205_28390 [Spinactinospora alkalitolerans]
MVSTETAEEGLDPGRVGAVLAEPGGAGAEQHGDDGGIARSSRFCSRGGGPAVTEKNRADMAE